ncbi:MAG: type II methionyl aminopeptidase [Euryarchaeota archaeon]|nr:type II methionyl aminopeptidase [Euryarchaeota archaeon]
MEEDAREKYIQAGKIAAQVMERGLREVRAGKRLLELAEFVESEIERLGGKPAFPVNISVNHIAAHYSPTAWDETRFEENDLVKLDIGVHVDGYIADIARSIVVGGEKNELILASEEALQRAIEIIRPGVRTSEIGAAVEETIRRHGFKPVENLTGHRLGRYSLHGGMTVPNVRTRHGDVLREGDVVAIEPFATTGAGRVVDEKEAIIFRYLRDRPLRMRESRAILAYVKKNFGGLPFAERWVAHLAPRHRLQLALRELAYSGAIYAYRILREKKRAPVAQAEHTVMVTSDGCVVTTG